MPIELPVLNNSDDDSNNDLFDIFEKIDMFKDDNVPIIDTTSKCVDKIKYDPKANYRKQAYIKFKNKRASVNPFKKVKHFPKKICGNVRDSTGKFIKKKTKFISITEHKRLYDCYGNKKNEQIMIHNIKKKVRFNILSDYELHPKIKFET